jgi:hypothetical protein
MVAMTSLVQAARGYHNIRGPRNLGVDWHILDEDADDFLADFGRNACGNDYPDENPGYFYVRPEPIKHTGPVRRLDPVRRLTPVEENWSASRLMRDQQERIFGKRDRQRVSWEAVARALTQRREIRKNQMKVVATLAQYPLLKPKATWVRRPRGA